MSGGVDILIIGIADENLDYIASDKELGDLFGDYNEDKASIDKYVTDFHALADDPTIQNPRIFYLVGEHFLGSQDGAGLGYVIHDGNLNSPPKKLDDRIFRRIDELKQKFINEIEAKGFRLEHNKVGVYALNVHDT